MIHIKSLSVAISLTIGAIGLAIFSTPAWAGPKWGEWKHGDTLFGELKYKKGFPHYDHVNPEAPKGGTLNRNSQGGFDSFNPFIVKGRPAPGLNYIGGLLYDSLLSSSVDQSAAAYGMIAEAFRYTDDYSQTTYRLNAKAKWHDGVSITPEDVIWSLKVMRENQPLFTDYYKNIESATKTGEHEITFKFDIKGNRELPNILGDLPILPKHWWEGKDAKGEPRDITEPLTGETPLGSSAYKIAKYDMGQTITWERVKDYWAKDLNINKGRHNYDFIRYTNFENTDTAWEGFKKGGISDARTENRSRRWSTEYNFPAFKRGDVVRKAWPTEGSETYQAFYINTRKVKFQNRDLRHALTLLYDFETMNKNIFFGLYTRTDSYFEGGELQGTAKPEGRTREILEEYRGKIDDHIIDEAYVLPVIKNSKDTRKVRRQALGLLQKAGYEFKNGKMIDDNGRQFSIEILGSSPTDETIGLPYVESLKKLGIKASLRLVDDAQYKARIDNFNFDMTIKVTRQSLSPGNEQREYWSSAAAKRKGARNFAGISDPIIDELVERIIVAPNRAEAVALTKALDHVLLHGHYSIPLYHNPALWYAWWRKIKYPPNQPKFIGLDTLSGWIDVEAEKELAK
ncbi:MAG: ABC transporter substrate-binding protein [Rhizobiales bacterium]|nr:ABC transporter substrate-binding protein [Hyphomicrobiales bacterium]